MTNINYYNSKVGENAKQIINQKGLKQCVVAKKAGYTPQTLNDMLNSRQIMKAVDIENIAKVLNVEVNELFGIKKEGA